MKNKLITLTLFAALIISNVSAIEVLDISTQPLKPQHGDTVNVTAYVQGDGRTINSVDLDVSENGINILNDAPMDYRAGDERDISSWQLDNAFTVNSTETEEFIYDLNVQAIDDQGNNDDSILTVDVAENTTIIDPEEEPEEDQLFGIDVLDWIIYILLLALGFTLMFN